MMRNQRPEYHDRARSLLKTYGIRPLTSAFYPMLGAVDAVEQYTVKLLDGHLTPKGFAAEMAALRP
jgi:hypothetical protein